MALKVVPAGDERCDIHTDGRKPPKYVCESCLKEFGIDPDSPDEPRRSLRARLRRARRRTRRRVARPDRGLMVGAGIAVAVIAVVVTVLATSGGGDAEDTTTGGPPTQADVINALQLVPNLNGTGWITPDSACWVVSMQFGTDVPKPGPISGKGRGEATNENRTVGTAVSQNDVSVSENECVTRIGNALRAKF
jgi:hypothetical protein